MFQPNIFSKKPKKILLIIKGLAVGEKSKKIGLIRPYLRFLDLNLLIHAT